MINKFRPILAKQEYIFIYLAAFFSWIFIFYNMQTGFKSCMDEAFFILGLNPEQNLGIQHTQFFQIVRFIFRVFSIEPTIIHSRIAAYICIIFTLFFFSCTSYYWLNKKGKIKNNLGLYVSLVFLCGIFIFFSGYEVSLTFNHLLVFFVTCQFSFYLLWDVSDNMIIRQLCIYLSGFFSFLSIVNYFPSGILVSLAISLLILQKRNLYWKNKLLSLFIFLLGLLSCIIVYNYVIYPVKDALSDIIINIRNPAFGTGGYNLVSYMNLVVNYAGVFMLLLFCCIGISSLYSINQRQKQFNKKSVTVGIFIAVLILSILTRKLFKFSILLIPVMTSFLFYLSQTSGINWHDKKRIGIVIQGAIFLFFPVIGVMGTNVIIIYKLTYLSFMWVFILAGYLFQIKDRLVYKSMLYLTVLLALGFGFFGGLYIYRYFRGNPFNSKYKVENNRQFSSIKLKKIQIDYFQSVEDILRENGFNPETDRIFTFDYDYATLLYLDVTNYGGLMHQVENMPAYRSVFFSQANAPDYIIVNEWDRGILKNMLKTEDFQWDFPAGYKEYKLGIPENEEINLTGNRRLFVKNRTNTE
ncbi:MAG: hypothetical protein LBO74_07925 [Candidatus Symbiothrix sp.]|jgi:hypothetical protein|nr:hypothetical protein [Candidatus Symbiothrix sp.]